MLHSDMLFACLQVLLPALTHHPKLQVLELPGRCRNRACNISTSISSSLHWFHLSIMLHSDCLQVLLPTLTHHPMAECLSCPAAA
jgi:hypothetical protein